MTQIDFYTHVAQPLKLAAKIIANVKRKTISALVYPAILVTLAIGLVSVIVLKVVPAFAGFYSSFNQELPLVTRGIVAVSDFVRANLWLLESALAFGADKLTCICLWDGGGGDGPGGTRHLVDAVRGAGGRVVRIDSSSL